MINQLDTELFKHLRNGARITNVELACRTA
jgi:hypothetical protein